jgi:dephospho-CoA kinase
VFFALARAASVSVMIVALTGGLGAGKSTVSKLLAERGAVIVDADLIAREVVEPGTPGLAGVVERFGSGILTAEGALNRPALAEVVFGDDEARRALNAIVHPLIAARSQQLIHSAPPGSIVVNDIPLLAESGRKDFDFVIVVLADLDVRLSRLEGRGMGREQAQARIAVQASDEERAALADVIVYNNGTHAELVEQVERVWPQLLERNVGTA